MHVGEASGEHLHVSECDRRNEVTGPGTSQRKNEPPDAYGVSSNGHPAPRTMGKVNMAWPGVDCCILVYCPTPVPLSSKRRGC